jgi:phosphatidylglycerophosphatase A
LTISADTAQRPSWRFVLSHPAHFFAFGFGSGLSPFAPGTAGTLVAFPVFWLMQRSLEPAAFLVALAFMFGLGIWFCAKAGRTLGVADHGGIVWDEIVAFLLVLFFVPPAWLWWLAGFLLFRLFDIWKPFPIRYFDARLKNGFGVMFDDLLAAGFAIAVVKGALWLM